MTDLRIHQITRNDGTSEYIQAERWYINSGALCFVGIPGNNVDDTSKEYAPGEWTSLYRDDSPKYTPLI